MSIEESKAVSEVFESLAENTHANYKSSLRQFHKFVNSKEGLSKEISIDNLAAEARKT